MKVMHPAAQGSNQPPEGGDRRAVNAVGELERLVATVDQSADLVTFFRADGTAYSMNQVAREFFGLSADEPLPPLTPEDLVGGDEATIEAIAETLDGPTGRWEGELDLIAPGRSGRFRLVVHAHRDPTGEVEYYSALGRDVGALREAEDRLVESQAWWRSLVQHASDVIMVLAEDQTVLYVTPSVERLLGYRPEDLVGSRMPGRRPDADERFRHLYREVSAKPGVPVTYETELTALDGSVRAFECTLTNLLDDPAVAGFVVNSRDITDRRRAEEARRRSEALLRSIVQHSPLAIYAIDGDGRIRLWNKACEVAFGWSADEVVGERPPFLGDESTNALYDETRALVFAGETITGVEVRRVRRDGSPVDISLAMAPLHNADGRVTTAVAVLADITEQRQANEELERSRRALAESEARYRGIVEDQTELVCRYLPDTTLTYVNRAFAAFYGGAPADYVGRQLVELFPHNERAAEVARLAAFGDGHEVEQTEDWEPRHDGAARWYQWTDRAYLDADGNIVEFQSVGRDVHERRQAERSLAWQAEILEMIALGTPLDETLLAVGRIAEGEQNWRCAVMLRDGDELSAVAAPTLPLGFLDALGRLPIADGGGTCGTAAYRGVAVLSRDLQTDPIWTGRHERLARFGIQAAWSVPLTVRGDIAGTICLYGSAPGEPDAEQRRIVELLARLATVALERKRFEDELAHQSLHDELTDLPNRTLFSDRLSLAMARASRLQAGLGVLFVDIDGFKGVNDSLGHTTGDRVLCAFAQRVESVLRPGDTLARFSGDEFVVLCEDLPHDMAREAATHIASRILEALASPFIVDDVEIFLRASIGIALQREPRERPDNLVRDADAATYRAKELGRARWVVFDDTLRERVVAEHTTLNELHRALERGELRVFFQPVVSLTRGRCVGAEALVRWQHPERGLVAPGEFIALAEQSDLIVELGEWVLAESARYTARWNAHARETFTVSVNLSGRQLAQADLAERVSDIIADAGCRADLLCLEITESVLMRDADRAVAGVDGLRNLGVKVAIDDFGTGYSSLAYLKRFSVDSVKVDRSFVDGLGSDPGDQAIVSAVVSMAHALGLRVVAEGVETETQLTELVALGCDLAQGYYFAPPQPVADLGELLQRTRPWRPPGARFLTA